MSDWINTPKSIEGLQGFVYVIKHKDSARYYVGKKFYWSKRTLKPLKGKKRKRHIIKESDWKDYWGSSKNLLADIEKYGKERFERWIVEDCPTKFDCSYGELCWQMSYDVLNDPDSYNEIINVRLRKRK